MDTKQAQDLIRQLFTHAFDLDRYQHFLRNLLNQFEPRDGHYTGNYIPDAFKQHVNQYWRIGKYADPDGHELDLLVVEVKSLGKLERARSALRNFAVDRLKKFDKEASLIAFYAQDDNGEDWRFSFVKIEHEAYRDDKGKVKLKQELTPAKRYSYLVGIHEDSHTACKQLLPVLTMDYADPRIDEIEAAFSIEKVTGEFFDQYKSLFVKLAEQLRCQSFFQRSSEEETDQAVNRFAKKLLGQIVFLYFLQKKGWLGVEQDKAWGTGPKRFMRQRYNQIAGQGGNYYRDFLQYLFYEALADERNNQADPGYYQRFDCRVPFLNGGLFEAEYDWQDQSIKLPNTLFHNEEKNKAGDEGSGILDVFGRYNFTIKEDEPLDKEVAVDPEMLGKVFENMLEVTERKSKGAFYTPREIVHYMCQESLINYLHTELQREQSASQAEQQTLFDAGNGGDQVSREDLNTLIRKGHLFVENDEAAIEALQRIEQGQQKTTGKRVELPESIKRHATLLDEKLATIKVCDPAIGSGAFPVGLLHEIVTARLALAPHSDNRQTPYQLKRHAIAESIYGVDIDPSAIDIARLRLWLSLIVDEEDYGAIEALPNLDYKIMQGNSLVEEYWGVTLFNEEYIQEDDRNAAKRARLQERRRALDAEYLALHQANQLTPERKQLFAKETQKIEQEMKKLKISTVKDPRLGLFDVVSEAKRKARQLAQLHKDFFSASSPARKQAIRQRITALEWELIEATLTERNQTDSLAQLAEVKKNQEKPFFLWKLNFAEVFKEKGGFDVVIGNPPYMIIQTLTKANPEAVKIYKKKFSSATGKFDIYCLFIEKGLDIINKNGKLNYIMPVKWISSGFGIGLRNLISKGNNLSRLISFDSYQVFNASTYTSLIWLSRKPVKKSLFTKLEEDLKTENELGCWLRKQGNNCSEIDNSTLGKDPWAFTSGKATKILDEIRKYPPVQEILDGIYQGVVTGDNDSFLIKKCSIFDGIVRGFSKSANIDIEIERDIVRPLLYGKTVSRHKEKFNNTFLVYPYEIKNGKTTLIPENELKNKFPKAYSYLISIKSRLTARGSSNMNYPAWYSLWNQRSIERLSQKGKILTPDVCFGGSMFIDHFGCFFHSDTTYAIIPNKNHINLVSYIYSVLNSSVAWFFLIHTGSVQRGGYFRFKTSYIKPLPIPPIELAIQNIFDCLVAYQYASPPKLVSRFLDDLTDSIVLELFFPDQIKAAGKELLPHLGELTPLTDGMTPEEKLAVIQRQFDRLYDPRHPVRNHLETLDSVEVVRTIREALHK